MSVKECMDELPVGICFYRDGGLTKLTNLKMESIAQKLTGSSISDAESFREAVSQSEEAPVLSFEDGTTYSFVHRTELLDGKKINELIAFDVTEEYRLTQELREKQHRARTINARLKALNSTIQYIIMDKETLRIKMHIHDSLGKTLLMTRRYLAEPEKTDLKEVISLWGRNISMLKNEEREDWQEPHFVSFHHAEAKMKIIMGYSDKGEAICMIGDGVNDALALTSANAGIAMGGIGSDIAIESADAVLVSDEIKRLPYLFDMMQKVMKKIKVNIIASIIINLSAVILSAFGVLTPITGALWHNFGSVFVVVNAALLLRKKGEE